MPPPPPAFNKDALKQLFSPERSRRLLPLGFGVIFAIIALFFARQWRDTQVRHLAREEQMLREKFPPPPPPVQVIIASADIDKDVQLTGDHLEVAEILPSAAQPYAARSPQDVLGMVTIAPIAKGEQILANKLRRIEDAPTGNTLSSITPEGKRAITIVVDPLTGVGGFVRPGDHVDVLWTASLPAPGQQGGEGQPVTLTIFQEVPVLAVDASMVGRAAPAAEGAQQQMVTLALTPQEAALILFTREHGRIQLSLRPHDEAGQVAVPPADLQAVIQKVLGVAPQQNAEQPHQKTHEVEIYKGLKRDVVVLPDSG